jgi:hypothetical protein
VIKHAKRKICGFSCKDHFPFRIPFTYGGVVGSRAGVQEMLKTIIQLYPAPLLTYRLIITFYPFIRCVVDDQYRRTEWDESLLYRFCTSQYIQQISRKKQLYPINVRSGTQYQPTGVWGYGSPVSPARNFYLRNPCRCRKVLF